MTEQVEKNKLLDDMRSGYDAFEALLASLTEGQMTTKGVNGAWSVKDNVTHLNAWERRVINVLQAIKDGVEPPDPTPNMTEDEINELYYQQNKDRPLNEVLAEFRSTTRELTNSVEAMTSEQLNQPRSWWRDRPIWLNIAGNTYEHYEEHSKIIQDWLARS